MLIWPKGQWRRGKHCSRFSLFTLGSLLISAITAMVGFCPRAFAQHRTLLPKPRQITYRPGNLPLKNLSIHLFRDASREDWFAAKQLSACLSSRAGFEIPIRQSSTAGLTLALQRTGGVDALPQPGESSGPESRESYSISITPRGGRLRARSSAGLFYGAQTLCQMVQGNQQAAVLPDAVIHDWPSLAYRGVMVDASEGPTPTAEEVKRQIKFLSRWKINQYYLYSETNVQLKGYPLLSPYARFSQSEIRSIVSYARQRHIDVIPTLELYGHLHQLLVIEKYSDLSDFPHGDEFDPRNPKVMDLLRSWAAQYSQLFPSPFVHIGFDETWQIQEAARRENTSPVDLFVKQINDVDQLFRDHGKRVLAWEDIMVKFPGIIPRLPPGLIAVAWYYDPFPDPAYRHWLDPLVEHHVPFMIATGVNGWNEIVPDFGLTFDNIDTFVAAGRKAGTLGMMNTIWGDDAQLLMRMSWPGLAYGAAAAWQSAPVKRQAFFKDYATLMYPDAQDVASALTDLAQSEDHLQKVLGQSTMVRLWANPFNPYILSKCEENRDDLRQTRLLAEDAEEHVQYALGAGDNPVTLNSLLFGARLLDYAGMRYQYAVQISDEWKTLGEHPTPDQLRDALNGPGIGPQDLVNTITSLRPIYKREWLAEYYPYRLGSALELWNAEVQRWRRFPERLQRIERRFKSGDKLPSLQSVTQE